MFKESISKEELIDMPLKWFEGEIVLVDSKKKLQLAIDDLNDEVIIMMTIIWNNQDLKTGDKTF